MKRRNLRRGRDKKKTHYRTRPLSPFKAPKIRGKKTPDRTRSLSPVKAPKIRGLNRRFSSVNSQIFQTTSSQQKPTKFYKKKMPKVVMAIQKIFR